MLLFKISKNDAWLKEEVESQFGIYGGATGQHPRRVAGKVQTFLFDNISKIDI